MTEHAVHLLSGAYAVGALDDLERARFEAHLETCADCRAEVAGLLEATALLAETSAAEPPAARARRGARRHRHRAPAAARRHHRARRGRPRGRPAVAGPPGFKRALWPPRRP